jgi:putative DNA primase/helicase
MDVDQPLSLRFDPAAQELFVTWLTELEAKIRTFGMHGALVSHLAKYRSLMPSLAGLFELANGEADVISLEHAKQAAAWCAYLESHAKRIYSMIISPERAAAAELGRRLVERGLIGLFSLRTCATMEWTCNPRCGEAGLSATRRCGMDSARTG